MTENGDTVQTLLAKPQYEIVFRKPDSVLKKQLGDDAKIVGFDSEVFSKSGENYGSTMMKITVDVQRKNEDEVEKLDLVGKLLPPTDFQRQLFESDYSFIKEIFFYEQLIPTYQDIYKKEFSIVPRYYGSRLSLQPDADIVDEDAVLLLENLKVKNYYVEDRKKGLDLEHLHIIIPAIAKFHAIGLSIKHKKPSFLPVLKKYTRSLTILDMYKKMIKKMVDEIKDHSVVGQYYNRIKALYDHSKFGENYVEKTFELEEPWVCVIHFDLWTNNMMFHRNEDGKVDNVKIVDFQTYTVHSPLADLIFLLCTSMQYPLGHFDVMLELYRQTIYKELEELNVDACLFERKNFEERLKVDAIAEIFHIIMMTNVVEFREGDDFQKRPANKYVIRKWKRVFEIFGQKKWF